MSFAVAKLACLFVIASVGSSLSVSAEQAQRVYRIGIVANTSSPSPDSVRVWNAFLEGLREFGYVEPKNIAFVWRYSEGRVERFPELVASLVGSQVDLIMVYTTPAALAAKAATSTIPILIVTAIDPVGAGLAASLARPGGNVTGLATFLPELSAKWLELLKEVIPRLSRVAILWNAANPANALVLRDTEEAAHRLGIVLERHEVRSPDDFGARFAAVMKQRPDALLVIQDALTFEHRHQIAQFALQARLPSISSPREMVVAGGLMAYGPSYAEMFHRAAFYVDKLLKGTKPADLPFEQASTFELVINKKTARTLGVTIPASVLLRANEVIE